MTGRALVVLALWLGVIGYGVAYTGAQTLGGDPSCTLGKAFRGQCGGTGSTPAPAPGGLGGPGGLTLHQARMRRRQVQLDHLGSLQVIYGAS